MSAKNDLKASDAVMLLEALQHVTTTVIINVGEIAEKKGAKVNTIQKAFSVIKKRYNLNIQTTAVGACGPVKSSPNRVTKRAAPNKRSPKKTPSGKNAIDLTSNDDKADDGIMTDVKPKLERGASIKKEEDREMDDEEASTIRAHSVYQQPTPESPLSLDGARKHGGDIFVTGNLDNDSIDVDDEEVV